MDREPSLNRRALPPLHPLPTKRQCLKEAALPKVGALQHQARDFATLRAPQRATSAALSSDPFPFFSGGNTKRELLPELDFCVAIGAIFSSGEEALFCCTRVASGTCG